MSTYIYTHAATDHEPDVSAGHVFGMSGSQVFCKECGQILEYVEQDLIITSPKIIYRVGWRGQ